MRVDNTLRVMWLLNHTTLRKYEIDQLHLAGVNEIFTPKTYVYDQGNMSASITYEMDSSLTIPASDLEVLNNQNWYEKPSALAWDIANRYFDVVFFGFFPKQILSVVDNFEGALVLRAFGMTNDMTYSKAIYSLGGERLQRAIKRVSPRFWFGKGYEHLDEIEEPYISKRSVFLPVGLQSIENSHKWEGEDRHILFVCPRIGTSEYYNKIYTEFCQTFKDVNYVIAGAQPITVPDTNVLGYVDDQRYSKIMRHSRVMFYHSQEQYHIHYHPFEAIKAGMPLVFMENSLLDRLGGKKLPGRCKDFNEARAKIKRILKNDWKFINKVVRSQVVLLESMEPKACSLSWGIGFKCIIDELRKYKTARQNNKPKQAIKRIAVIMPVGYSGGTLRGAKALANTIYKGSKENNDQLEVIFYHTDEPHIYNENSFLDLHPDIALRKYFWQKIDSTSARSAMRFAGYEGWEPSNPEYIILDDGINNAFDCDLWLFISDRLTLPILPLKPIVVMVYDYLSRYEKINLSTPSDMPLLNAARAADIVLTTTEFTANDAKQYAGIDAERVRQMPMLVPEFEINRNEGRVCSESGYFVWTTNSSIHKNHINAAKALRKYYDELDGKLTCIVTGWGTKNMLELAIPHIQIMANEFKASEKLSSNVTWLGELSDKQYKKLLSEASFLWHAGKIDNGTFSVIEAACFGVASLSSDYPAMREINDNFSLNLAWMDPNDPIEMAHALKEMELSANERRSMLPNEDVIKNNQSERLASQYWGVIKECL